MSHHHHDDDHHHDQHHEHDHHHDHDHSESHHHHEHHDHPHHHESREGGLAGGAPSEQEKLLKMVHHWIHHNEEHAQSYRQWGDRARALGQHEVARILDTVADENIRLNGEMDRILGILQR